MGRVKHLVVTGKVARQITYPGRDRCPRQHSLEKKQGSPARARKTWPKHSKTEGKWGGGHSIKGTVYQGKLFLHVDINHNKRQSQHSISSGLLAREGGTKKKKNGSDHLDKKKEINRKGGQKKSQPVRDQKVVERPERDTFSYLQESPP